MKIAIAAAGTGGHIYPALSIAEALSEKGFNDIIFITSNKGIEKDLLSSYAYNKTYLSINPMKNMLSIIPLILSLISSTKLCVKLLKKKKVNLVFSCGGYSSLPVIFAAKLLRIKVVIHEQNILPGKTNRICGLLADKIIIAFEPSLKYFNKNKTLILGNPLRASFSNSLINISLPAGLTGQTKPIILIFGGSQGSASINKIVQEIILLDRNFIVFHICGKNNFSDLTSKTNCTKIFDSHSDQIYTVDKIKDYFISPYLNNIQMIYHLTKLVVSRAGAMALSEFSFFGLASILIPYPHAAADHQSINARYFEKNKASMVICEDQLSGSVLIDKITRLLNNPEHLHKMSQSAQSLSQKDSSNKITDLLIRMNNE